MNNTLHALYYELGTVVLDRREKIERARIARERKRGVKFHLGPRPRRTRAYVIDAALDYLSRRYTKLHDLICKRRKRLEDALESDEAEGLIVLADVVAAVVISFPPILIAKILAKIGLKRFCDGNPFSRDNT